MTEQWTDNAFVLGTSPLNERDMLVELLSREHGRLRTVAKFGATGKHRATYQLGNLLHVEWKARLPTQMGQVKAELQRPYFALFAQFPLALLALQSASALITLCLHEHDRAERVFDALEQLCEECESGIGNREMSPVLNSQFPILDSYHTIKHYTLFEQHLLSACGFGLDVSACAATGTTEELAYVSPKSGRAVSRAAGRPYHDRLFPLPAYYLQPDTPSNPAECLDALRINAYFMERRLCAEDGRALPAIRDRLEQKIKDTL